jgi:hypothetical protein
MEVDRFIGIQIEGYGEHFTRNDFKATQGIEVDFIFFID